MSFSKINQDLDVVVSSLMSNNSYILYNNKEVIIIDPSFGATEIINHLGDNYIVVGIMLTHAHFDHTFETAKLIKKYDCSVYMLDKEKETYELYDCSNWFEREVPDFSNKVKYIKAGNNKIGSFNFNILHTPGHTSGGMTIIYKNYVFSGDTLFFDSYGRTDLYNSSQQQMKQSLKLLFNTIKNDQVVLPGHGQFGKFKDLKEINLIAKELIE